MNDELLFDLSKKALRIILGTIFITAAFLKLLSIDYFEIYIYSFNIFSFTLTTVVSRLLIAVELLLGFGLILKIYYKQVWWLSMLIMVGFTLFLAYVIIYRNDDNCHCFGELVKLNPSESIFKNAISVLFLLVIRKEEDCKYRPKMKKWLMWLSISLALALPFVVFPMDKLYKKIISKDNNINILAFDNSLKDSIDIVKIDVVFVNDTIMINRDSLLRFDVSKDKYIINYVSAGCEFCKMGVKKLKMMFEHNNIDKKHLKFMIWGYDKDIISFIEETKTTDCEFWFIPPLVSLDITFGKFPVYIWTANGDVINSGDLRDLDENKIVDFLNKK